MRTLKAMLRDGHSTQVQWCRCCSCCSCCCYYCPSSRHSIGCQKRTGASQKNVPFRLVADPHQLTYIRTKNSTNVSAWHCKIIDDEKSVSEIKFSLWSSLCAGGSTQDEGEKKETTLGVNNISAARRLSRILQQAILAQFSIIPNKNQSRATASDKKLFSLPIMTTKASDKNASHKDSYQVNDGLYFDQLQSQDRDLDAGYAWIILAVIFFISASSFGTMRAYTLIFERKARDSQADQASSSRASAALPFTLMGAIENMSGPLSGYLLSRFQNSSRMLVIIGSSMICLSHLLASYSVELPWGQILSMGFMCGFGMSFVTISFFQINNAYFVRYRSTAYGIGLTGAAFGAFYISPICQYVLQEYDLSSCYLILALILLPNVPLALLLKPKKASGRPRLDSFERESIGSENIKKEVWTLSKRVESSQTSSSPTTTITRTTKPTFTVIGDEDKIGFRHGVRLVLKNPMFYLIWPTQLLFCWYNFVFGMIIVDFGRDRGLSEQNLGRLPPIWAAGQLFGRLVLGPLVDLKYLTYRTWTVLCFSSIGVVMLALNSVSIDDDDDNNNNKSSQQLSSLIMLMLTFILSTFIALLFLLLNGLIVVYVDQQLQPLCMGLSSFVGSFLLLPRALVIGYYRDTIGNYDSMISLFIWVSLASALIWLLGPILLIRRACPKSLALDRLRKFLVTNYFCGFVVMTPTSKQENLRPNIMIDIACII